MLGLEYVVVSETVRMLAYNLLVKRERQVSKLSFIADSKKDFDPFIVAELSSCVLI